MAGCSQTGALGSSNTSDVRTVASVGDKPLPIVSGSQERHFVPRPKTSIAQSPAAPGSRVESMTSAVSPCPSEGSPCRGRRRRGQSLVATTDRSGAFTLRGLRPGTSYTVIAEYEDEDGTMSGRAQVKAPESDVRIALQPRGGVNQGHASIRPARSKSNRSRTSIPWTKSRSTRAEEDRDAASTPRTWSRRQPKRQPFFPRIA